MDEIDKYEILRYNLQAHEKKQLKIYGPVVFSIFMVIQREGVWLLTFPILVYSAPTYLIEQRVGLKRGSLFYTNFFARLLLEAPWSFPDPPNFP